MKVLIANAVWGEDYCDTLTEYSLASLLASGNIPNLSKRASITFHFVTTRRDRKRLVRNAAIQQLGRYCTLEWVLLEDLGILRPPTGAGGEKYSFLSALQNIAITRALDHDAIVFNYADFIWADGSLPASLDMLDNGNEPADAVLAFCVPVDRDSAKDALEEHRRLRITPVIELSPRDGQKLVAQTLHREAGQRFWDAPGFTNLPSYMLWPVQDQGFVLRAYHQSILALRVRRNDPTFRHGIERGSLDSSFVGSLAKRNTLAFATDTDRVLVFSLYHTPIDSRLPPGISRESSLRSVLQADVTPEQRSFANTPFLFRVSEDDAAEWERVIDESGALLRAAEDATAFEIEAYDQHEATHGVVPRIPQKGRLYRRYVILFVRLLRRSGLDRTYGEEAVDDFLNKAGGVLRRPSSLRSSSRLRRRITRIKRIIFVLQRPSLLYAAAKRRINPGEMASETPQIGKNDAELDSLFADGDADAVEAALPGNRIIAVAPNVVIESEVNARFSSAISIESEASRATDFPRFRAKLRTAEELLRRAMEAVPAWPEPARALGRNLWFQGRHQEAIEAFATGESRRDDMARAAGWPVDECLFLPRNCTEIIGLMGHIEAFAKYKILTGDRRPYYLLAGPQNIVNPAFLDYWKAYITVVTDPAEIARLSAREPVYGVNWNWVMPRDGEIAFIHPAMASVMRAWEKSDRAPLLTLREDHAAVLTQAQAEWGMKEGDRFVCLHVRSVGFYGAPQESAQQFRNTSIDPYYPLIRNLTEKGYWVFRMGDSAMQPLDLAQCGSAGRVVDYALSPKKSAELDVALCARCELFVSSPSGLHTVAHAFGRPVCEVNYPIYEGFPWHPGDIFVPQLYMSREKGRVLTLEEILGTDILHCDHQFLLEQAGISLAPNEPDEIVETVLEALAPSAYRVADEARADEVCAAFDNLNRRYDRSISGKLGRYFAAKHAARLLPNRAPVPEATPAPLQDRKLDFLLAVYNRPAYLHHILKSGLALGIPGASFVVFDDASDLIENVPGFGPATVESVCRSFADPRIIYRRNPANIGVAKSIARYYRELGEARYTSLLNPKDEFISAEPIIEAIRKLDADERISFVVYPLRENNRDERDKALLFRYPRMTGREFVAAHVRDSNLQHCSGYALMRVSAARKVDMPRDLDLRASGLEDASGIDHDMLFTLATTGDVDFVEDPPIRRSIVDGYTERFPLTFSYSQYQYARRLMQELEPAGFVTRETKRRYISFWHLIIARGLVVAYRHVHGSEQEQGVKRIQPHLRMPILLYLPLECVRFRVLPRVETIKTYIAGAKLLLADWRDKIAGRAHLC